MTAQVVATLLGAAASVISSPALNPTTGQRTAAEADNKAHAEAERAAERALSAAHTSLLVLKPVSTGASPNRGNDA
jgi:hypothetical protein